MDRLSLRAQILLATFLPLVVFALLAGGFGAYALLRIPENLALERQTALAQVAAAGVSGTLRGYIRLLEATATELAAYPDDPARQQQLLTIGEDSLAVFTGGTGLVDASGRMTASTARSAGSLGLNFAERPYFQDVKATLAPSFSSVLRDEPTGEPTVVIAVPVRRDGAFAGALLGELSLSRPEWARDLNLLRTPQGGRAYLIDSGSTVIYHPDPGRVEANVQAEPDLWRLVIGGQPGSALYRPAGSAQLMIVTYAPIPGIGWGLIVEEPWNEVLSSIASYETISAGLLLLGILLAMAALLLSVSRVTRPLRGLVAAGQRVTAGKEYQTLPLEGPRDLRIVIQAINSMADHLGAQQAALRQYARQVVDGQEEERLRISRDLHDETVQELVALTQRIELAADTLEDDPALARRRLRAVQTLAHRVLRDVRRVSQNLRPSILEDLGLVAALQVLTRDLGEAMPDAHVNCEVLGEAVRLPHDLELTAFRIAQEALNNVRKHASGATRVNVVLAFEPWGATLVVEDNGSGFATGEGAEGFVRTGHLGLAGMAERARLFGGEFTVASAPGEGTTVTLRLPLAEEAGLPLPLPAVDEERVSQ